MRAELTQLDAFQVVSLPLLRHLLLELDWRGRPFRVVDHLVRQTQVAGKPRGEYVTWRSTPLQAIYVPLRELLRKFDGYGGKLRAGPALALPPQANQLPRDKLTLCTAMQCRNDACVDKKAAAVVGDECAWRLPGDWTREMLRLYATPPPPEGTACVVAGSMQGVS